MVFRFFLILVLALVLNSCSKNNKIDYIESKKNENVFEIYNEGLEAFKINDFFYASEKCLPTHYTLLTFMIRLKKH